VWTLAECFQNRSSLGPCDEGLSGRAHEQTAQLSVVGSNRPILLWIITSDVRKSVRSHLH